MRISDRLAHKRPVFSFEFFPPKTAEGEASLLRSLERLAPLEPDFVSVTYGAGGSTRDRTIELVTRIRRDFGIEPLAHLTCVGATRDELRATIDRLGSAGVANILALRGDPPQGTHIFTPSADGLRDASELVALIADMGGFCVGVAAYPETHPEAKSSQADVQHLKRKVDAGADFMISQLFFDNDRFFAFEQRVHEVGIEVPMLAGIMPVTSVTQVERFTSMCGASMPEVLRARLHESPGDAQAVFWTGVSYAAYQCRALLHRSSPSPFEPPRRGVAGIHFYTLNRSPATRAIFEILKLARLGGVD